MAWALDGEVESQPREEPAHRLREREYSWSLKALCGVDVYVEAVRVATLSPAAVEFTSSAGATGFLPGHVRGNRRITLSLEGHAAREPTLLYLVFETGGHAYAYETLEEAGEVIESTDLNEGHYIGAFSDQGEVIEMSPDGLWVEFSRSGTFDHEALATLVRGSLTVSELHADPHRFALRFGTPVEGATALAGCPA